LDWRLDGPQNRSARRGEGKRSYPYRISNSDLSAVQPVASRYTDCAIPAANMKERIEDKGEDKNKWTNTGRFINLFNDAVGS
jgi:hypothetical protein